MEKRPPSKFRERLWPVFTSLFVLASLPLPRVWPEVNGLLITTLWVALGFFSASLWYWPGYSWTLWFLGLVLSFVGWLRGLFLGPMVLLVLWALWMKVREKNRAKRETSGMLALILLATLGAPGASAADRPKTLLDSARGKPSPSPSYGDPGSLFIPQFMKGYKINDLVSCGVVNDIPWRFRQDNRKTRLLVRDNLRLQTETRFSLWEFHQVMDTQGYVTYVFRRQLVNGRYETIAAKDQFYSRYIETKRGRKKVEVQNLKTLVNRPVLVFVHGDGSSLSFLPGLAGRSLVTIQLSQKDGRYLSPVFLKGSVCDRPADERLTGDQAAGGTGDVKPLFGAPGAGP